MTKPSATSPVRIEVFRPGTFTPMAGSPISYSADDLAEIVRSYDPDLAPAPVVVGHPSTDAPAFAWVTGFDFDQDNQRLHAEIGDIEPAFGEAVKAGRYKRVSMSFYRPDASNNPAPGKWYPKHVGFLGAAAPAVPGLKPVAFASAAPEEVATFEAAFGERGFEESASLFRSLREFIIEKFSTEDADKVLPAYRLEWLDNMEVSRPDPAGRTSAFSAPPVKTPDKDHTMTREELAAQQADLEKRQAEQDAREARFAEGEQQRRAADNAAFAEELVKEGRLLPASKDQTVSILNALPAEETVSFSEDGKETKQPLADALKTLLKDQPVAVDFSATDLGEQPGAQTASFASDGRPVDTDQLQLDAKARAYQAQHPGTDYITAVQAVS